MAPASHRPRGAKLSCEAGSLDWTSGGMAPDQKVIRRCQRCLSSEAWGAPTVHLLACHSAKAPGGRPTWPPWLPRGLAATHTAGWKLGTLSPRNANPSAPITTPSVAQEESPELWPLPDHPTFPNRSLPFSDVGKHGHLGAFANHGGGCRTHDDLPPTPRSTQLHAHLSPDLRLSSLLESARPRCQASPPPSHVHALLQECPPLLVCLDSLGKSLRLSLTPTREQLLLLQAPWVLCPHHPLSPPNLSRFQAFTLCLVSS